MDYQEKHIEIRQKLLTNLKNELLSWEIEHAVKPRKAIDDIESLIQNYQRIVEIEKLNLQTGRYFEKKDECVDLSKQLNLNIKDDEHLVKLFCHLKTKYDIKFYEIIKNRLSGDYDSENKIIKELESSIPSISSPIEQKPIAVHKSKKLREVIDEYLQLNENIWEKTTQRDYFNYTNWFKEIVGDIYLDEVDHTVINYFVDTIQKIPVHRNKKPEYRDKDIAALVKMNCKEVISPRTVQNITEHISSFFKWCISRGYINTNYAQGKFRSKKESRTIFEPYTLNELNKIFYSKDYLESKFKSDYNYWLPIFGLYTGCRINEIAQLQKKDVVFNDEIPFIRISSTGENQSVKTQAGERDIPLHKMILTLGFKNYVNDITLNGNKRIFPDLVYKNYSYGANATRWYKQYIENLNITPRKPTNKKTFHCWRSTFALICKEQDMPERQIHELIGHRDRDMSLDYYAPAYSVEKLYNDVIRKLDFRIDLTPLLNTEYFSNFKQ